MRGVIFVNRGKHLFVDMCSEKNFFDSEILDAWCIRRVVTVQGPFEYQLPSIEKNDKVTYLHVAGIHKRLQVSVGDVANAARYLVNDFIDGSPASTLVYDNGQSDDQRALAFAMAYIASRNNRAIPWVYSLIDSELLELPKWVRDKLIREFQ